MRQKKRQRWHLLIMVAGPGRAGEGRKDFRAGADADRVFVSRFPVWAASFTSSQHNTNNRN